MLAYKLLKTTKVQADDSDTSYTDSEASRESLLARDPRRADRLRDSFLAEPPPLLVESCAGRTLRIVVKLRSFS